MSVQIFDDNKILVRFSDTVSWNPMAYIYKEDGKIICKSLTVALDQLDDAGYISILATKDEFFKGAKCMPILNFPSKFSDQKIKCDYHDISPFEKLEDAWDMAQFINRHSILVTLQEIGFKRGGWVNDEYSYLVTPIDNTCRKTTLIDSGIVKTNGEVFKMGIDGASFTEGTYFMPGGKALFGIGGSDTNKLCETALDKRYIYDLYTHLEEGECLGFSVDKYGCPTMLGAKIIGEQVIVREIEKLPPLQIHFSQVERPPYFILQDGKFIGVCEERKFFTEIPKDNELFQPMFDWYMKDGVEAFTLSKEMKYGIKLCKESQKLDQELSI